jgi:hypothetical protein
MTGSQREDANGMPLANTDDSAGAADRLAKDFEASIASAKARIYVKIRTLRPDFG